VLNLECLKKWAEYYKMDSETGYESKYFKYFNKLQASNVKFPEQPIFYNYLEKLKEEKKAEIPVEKVPPKKPKNVSINIVEISKGQFTKRRIYTP
jgi:hypothetical protein